MTDLFKPADTRASYDTVARHYADEIAGELASKPFDRDFLRTALRSVSATGK